MQTRRECLASLSALATGPFAHLSGQVAMPAYRYLHYDVFTDSSLTGNQLAVFTDPAGLDTDTMAQMTREMNFSECTFVFPSERTDTDVRLRIFGLAGEMPFAGHPVIGSTFALAHDHIIKPGQPRLVFGLGLGPTPVDLEWKGRGEDGPGEAFLRRRREPDRRCRGNRRDWSGLAVAARHRARAHAVGRARSHRADDRRRRYPPQNEGRALRAGGGAWPVIGHRRLGAVLGRHGERTTPRNSVKDEPNPESTVRVSSFCAISIPWSAQRSFAFDSGEEGAKQNLCDLSCRTVRPSALTLDHESCSPPFQSHITGRPPRTDVETRATAAALEVAKAFLAKR
jgi:Phenazine biosynthesis-like protein